ncbi:hypothetical protein [Mycolicibacterium hodleri]|nr:hypothetical protein [Mycolicibacterium hodleri]
MTVDTLVDAVIVRTADEWAGVIRADLTQAVEGIVSAGRNLIRAKADVAHGEWLPMLADIGISQSHASHLMQIGANPALSDQCNSTSLPMAARALYELSRLDPVVIEEGISNGDITPSTTIRDAREFARGQLSISRKVDDVRVTGIHPYAAIFPMLPADEMLAFVRSVRRWGLLMPIVLTPDGLILDGKIRYEACQLTGVQPIFITYDGDDLFEYVLAANVYRDHRYRDYPESTLAELEQ